MKRLVFTCIFASIGSTACVHVPAYDRGALAHPTMTPLDLARPGEEHARDVQEGSTGGGLAAGGGCGCN